MRFFGLTQMSANFWTSSHSRWLVKPQDLPTNNLSVIDNQKLSIYYTSVIHKLARSIAHVLHVSIRQQVIATSIVYFKRFYFKNEIKKVDPMLMCAVSYYLACKAEECPTHIKTVVNEMRHLFAALFPYEAKHISEYEFYLLQDLEFYTIVYHPYKTLEMFVQKLGFEKLVLQGASYQ